MIDAPFESEHECWDASLFLQLGLKATYDATMPNRKPPPRKLLQLLDEEFFDRVSDVLVEHHDVDLDYFIPVLTKLGRIRPHFLRLLAMKVVLFITMIGVEVHDEA
jgi:hypothetical protein